MTVLILALLLVLVVVLLIRIVLTLVLMFMTSSCEVLVQTICLVRVLSLVEIIWVWVALVNSFFHCILGFGESGRMIRFKIPTRCLLTPYLCDV